MQWKEENRKSTNKHLAHSLEKAEKYELLRFKIESIWHFCSFDKHYGAKFRIFVSFNIVQGSNVISHLKSTNKHLSHSLEKALFQDFHSFDLGAHKKRSFIGHGVLEKGIKTAFLRHLTMR